MRRARWSVAVAVAVVVAGAEASTASTVVEPAPIETNGTLDEPIILPLTAEIESLDGSQSIREQGNSTTVVLATDVLFAFGSAELSSAAVGRIDEVVARLAGYQGAVAVDGYTDSVGSDAVNLPLSEARARAVADVLGAKVEGVTFTVVGHGEDDPIAAEEFEDGTDNPMGRAKNRRVEITYIG